MKKLSYGVGLFIVFLMMLGLAINYVGKWIGVAHPLNSFVILITFWFSVLVALGINKKRIYNWVKSWQKIHPSAYVLMLLPIMAIAGAELVNATNNNIILMVMLPLLVIVPVICMFTKLIPRNYWGFAIWMISLAILLHRVLISPNLSGSDNILELSCYRATLEGGIFPANNAVNSFYGTYNTVLSVTILPVMINKIFFINGVWIFKLIFPLFLSFVPVAVYELVRIHFIDKVALLSAFVIMSVYTFYTEILITDKTLIATVLFAVFFLLFFDNIPSKMKWWMLFFVGLGVILAHYSTALFFVVLINGICLVSRKKSYIILSAILTLLGVVWYLTQGNGQSASHLATIGQSLITGSSSILSSGGTINEVVRIFTKGISYLPPTTLIFYVISQVSIVCGFIYIVWQKFIKKVPLLNMEYLALSFMMLCLLVLEVIPKFSSLIGLDRIYLYCMMILIPFIFVFLVRITKKWAVISVIFCACFFLTNVGWFNQVIGKPISDSIALNYSGCDYPVFTDNEIRGAEWLMNQTNKPLFTDAYSQLIFYYIDSSTNYPDKLSDTLMLFKLENNQPIIINPLPVGSYIYLRKYNFVNDELTMVYYNFNVENITEYPINDLGSFAQVVKTAKTIYINPDCEIVQTTINYAGD